MYGIQQQQQQQQSHSYNNQQGRSAADYLIRGTVKALYENDQTHPGIHCPWLQVTNIRRLVATTPNNVDRYRVLLSDGEYTVPGKCNV